MASISHDRKTGRRTIQFVGQDGKRRSLRLGKVNKRQAETVRGFIENLLACKVSGSSPKATTAEWVAGLPNAIRRRLERTDLILPQERRECPTVAEWVAHYIDSRRDIKHNTLVNYRKAQANILEFFGDAKPLEAVTPGDAEDFRIFLKSEKGLAEGTIRRRCKRVKQFFTAAVKRRIIPENPFAGIRCGSYSNPERFYFVSMDEAQAVLDACPDAEWRLLFALCRFGGLRCPTDVLRLTWADVDWEGMRFTVHSSKTEHHADGGIRQVPIFSELYPYLQDCFEQAEPGTKYVITRYRNTNANLRTQLGRIIKRAGLATWPKLFQNLRSTRETELTQQFPIHVVCKWIGNSQLIAAKHYLQVTEEHFAKAVQNPVQYPAVLGRTASQPEERQFALPPICGPMQTEAVPCESREPLRMTPGRVELPLPG